MERFRIQLVFKDNSWSKIYTINKKTKYSNLSTEWSFLNLNFTTEKYGNKVSYDEIYTPHADMCSSSITISHSVYSIHI